MHKRWFCACRDGFLDYKELETLAHRTAGTLTAEDYIALCGTKNASRCGYFPYVCPEPVLAK
jgi:hypothetical protein